MDQKILMILGMHRSGTSMLAQWLSACGLNLGDKLQGKTATNKFGHYEDSEFYNFHRKLLSQNHEDYLITDDGNLKVSPKMKIEAQKIIDRRSNLQQWSWKEPRTCVFLPLWDELLPNAYSIVICRHYDEVVDSLYRRESTIKKKVSKTEAFKRVFQYIDINLRKNHYYNEYLKVWILHNRAILKYIELKGLKHILIFDVDELLQRDDLIFDKLTKWGFKLKKTPISSIFSASSMQRNSSWGNYDAALKKEADAILTAFETLKKKAA